MKKFIALVLLFFPINLAFAQIEITEVMYSPVSGGEWVEIYNAGESAVDLKGWKLFDGANHTISTTSFLINPKEYLILANDKNAFISAFNTVKARVLDIVTSLNNDGDTVVLKNANGVEVASMSYTQTAGADKNSKSLQLIGAEYLPYNPPSPGEATVATKDDVEDQKLVDDTSTTQNTNEQASSVLTSPYHAWPSDMNLYVSAGEDKTSLAGAKVTFSGQAFSASKKTLPNADMIWTFGDGGSDRGREVSHIFHFPGKYIVILDVISGDYIAKDETFVTVLSPKLSITNTEEGVDGYIEIKNNTSSNLDIGGYIISGSGLYGQHFTLPKNTFIFAGKSIIFPNQITKLFIQKEVQILFPGGEVIASENIASSTESKVDEAGAEDVLDDYVEVNQFENVVPEVKSGIKSVADFLSKNLVASVFNESVPVVSSSTEEIVSTSTTEISESLPVAAAASSDISYKGLVGVLVIVLSALALVYTLHYFDKTSKTDDDFNVDDIEIIE